MRHERDYIERTIATVRNHQGADSCWPQWANIFADEIEAAWAEREQLELRLSNQAATIKEQRAMLDNAEAALADIEVRALRYREAAA